MEAIKNLMENSLSDKENSYINENSDLKAKSEILEETIRSMQEEIEVLKLTIENSNKEIMESINREKILIETNKNLEGIEMEYKEEICGLKQNMLDKNQQIDNIKTEMENSFSENEALYLNENADLKA